MLVFLLPTRETKKFMVILFCLENFLQFFREERQSWSRHHLPNLIASLAFFVALQKQSFIQSLWEIFLRGHHYTYIIYYTVFHASDSDGGDGDDDEDDAQLPHLRKKKHLPPSVGSSIPSSPINQLLALSPRFWAPRKVAKTHMQRRGEAGRCGRILLQV